MRDWFTRLRSGNAFEGPFRRKHRDAFTTGGKVRPHAYTVTRWMRFKRWLSAIWWAR